MRIAIAKHCGIEPMKRWRFFYDAERQHGSIDIYDIHEAKRRREDNMTSWISAGGKNETISEPEQYDEWKYAPDYLNDLNAMHEAEKTLTEDGVERYCEALNETSGSDSEKGKASFVAYFSNARQRAEAFVLAIAIHQP